MLKLLELKKNRGDEVHTPMEAVLYLSPFLKREWIIWECASGSGVLANNLRGEGFKVIEGQDFFSESFEADIIITNPPYSLKDKFIQRAYSLNKPFCLLLPITALEGRKRGELYRR